MEKYVVSARKYRPSTFKSVVGQHALVNTLKNAVVSDRLAHSYLFCGQRGVGKTTMARIFAKAINCEHRTPDGEPCNECESCKAFNEQRSMNIIELDAASNNSVDDIRQLTDQVLIPPSMGRYRVFIVDEVHMLSAAAFNAFLKTLEEPPSYVIFILATTERQKILPTILSRCQKYDFQRITPADIAEHLQYVAECEGYTAEPEALNVIAQKADGAMRDALSIFDQVAASSLGNITYQAAIDNLNILDYDYYFRLVDAFLEGNVEQSLLLFKDVRDHGFDSKVFINGLASHLRELVVAHTPALASLLEVTGDIAQRYVAQSARCSLNHLYQSMDLCNTCDLSYTNATNKQFLVELTLIKICQLFGGNAPAPQPQQGLKKLEGNGGQQGQTHTAAPAPASAPQAPQPAQQMRTAAPQPSAAPSVQPRPVSPQPSVRPAAPQVHVMPSIKAVGGNAPRLVGVPTMSIRGAASPQPVAQKTEVAEAAQPQSHPLRTKAFTEEEFREAWCEFVRSHPDEIILINAMKASFPVKVDGETYEFVVDNQAQVDKVESKRPELMTFLRGQVSNDNLQLRVKVREAGTQEKLWTQKELLLEMVERNPKAKRFIDHFHLGFA